MFNSRSCIVLCAVIVDWVIVRLPLPARVVPNTCILAAMKEDAQLICPIGYDDKSDIWPTIQKFICDRLPLKDVTWKSPISSSFINIEKLPLRFLPSSAKLFHETHHPYRRFLAPYVHVYLLCAESMDAYKAIKASVKKWVEPYNNVKQGRLPWLIVYVPLGTSTMDVYQKVYSRLSSDFYTDKAGDHSVMLIIPPEPSSKRNASMSGGERVMQQSLFQQAYASLADLLGKLRDGVVASFQLRSLQYDADIRKLDSMRGTATFDFWQLFLVKESLALMYQMLQLPDRALNLYEELEALLAFVPKQSLPASDWPMVLASAPAEQRTPSKSSRPAGEGGVTDSAQKDKGESQGSTAESEGAPVSPNPHANSSSSSSNKPKKDLMTDACRTGEDIIAYSINQARMNILWNRFSLFQLQHYIFARQMYFLLVHLRQPTRCAEKALAYVRSSSASLEQQILRQPGASVDPDRGEDKLVQLRRAQADVWALTASLKLIRECRALLQLLVGGDTKFNSIFYPGTSNISGATAAAGSLSYSHNSSSTSGAAGTPGGGGTAHEAFQDNLAAISSASTHGSSMVYSSLAELSRSQHGLAHPAGNRKASVGGVDVSTAMSAAQTSSASMNPAAALRDVLFSPQLDIAVELRDSSRVLGDLIEFALRRLQALSSSTVRDAGKKALDLALSTAPFILEQITSEGGDSSTERARRTVTKVGPGGTLLAASNTTATSPRNADLVVTIEQELSMLDESRENEGVAEVGDRMDQILLSISQKVRSTSHFWSKLYELSTPSHLLVSAGVTAASSEAAGAEDQSGSNGRGSRADSMDSNSGSSPPGGSPFSSRLATPIGSPMVGASAVPTSSSAAVGGVALRKMISRHSSRSLVMSRSQLERGKLLELCLSVLGCSAQWHLQLLANRPRFALSAMLRCADLLMCNNQLLVAAKRLEEALQCGLLAPAAAYICSQGPGYGAGSLGNPANKRSIFQQCLAEEQLHQQQHLSHRAMNLATALQERMEYPLYGLWSPLWHWTLRKLLYCMQQCGKWEQYRIVIANLLVPTSADGVNRVHLQPESLLQDLLKEFIALSTVAVVPLLPQHQPHDSEVESAGVEEAVERLTIAEGEQGVVPTPASTAGRASPAIIPVDPLKHPFYGLPVLRLPLGNYFDISVGMIRSAPSASTSAVGGSDDYQPVLVKGFQVVREEWLPVAAMQCEGGRDSGYCLPVTLHSKLPGPVPVDSFVVVFKRFDADLIVHEMLQAGDNGSASADHTAIADALQVSGEEFVCAPMVLTQLRDDSAVGDKPVLMLQPGTHSICMKFHPPTLGDYRLDRILLSVGTVLFESHLLPAISSTLHQHPHLDALFSDETTRGGGGMVTEEGGGKALDDAAGSRIYTAGEGRALAALKEYFSEHNIIQVLAPPDVLELCCTLPPTVPLRLEDDAYFTIRTFASDELVNLTVKVWGKDSAGSAGGDSGSNSLTRGVNGENGLASALKQAHGKPVSGFVTEENATPAARRKQRVNPLDDDDVQAMASAAAAVASLLAQQTRDRIAPVRRVGSTEIDSAVLSFADVVHWVVLQSDTSHGAAALDTVIYEPIADVSSGLQILIAKVRSNRRLHLRVPFTVDAADEYGGDALLGIELTGQLMRGRCCIPITISRELPVHALQPISLTVEPYLLDAALDDRWKAVAHRDVLLQARLHNNTEVPLELTSYGIAPVGSDSSYDCTMLDGPSVLRAGDAIEVEGCGSAAQDEVVLLDPSEEFPAGLLLRFHNIAPTKNCCAVGFTYQRNPTAMSQAVHSGVYKHRTFTVRRSIVLDDGTVTVAAAGCCTDCVVVPAVDPLELTFTLQVASSTAGNSVATTVLDYNHKMAVAEHGKVYRADYVLTVQFPTSLASIFSADLTCSAEESVLTSLGVSLAETDDWMVCGRSRRILSCDSPNTTSAGSGCVETTFRLHWEMVPVCLGVVPLPPLKVDYSWAGRQGGDRQLVYPSPLLDNDCVLVAPAVCSTASLHGVGRIEEFHCSLVSV